MKLQLITILTITLLIAACGQTLQDKAITINGPGNLEIAPKAPIEEIKELPTEVPEEPVEAEQVEETVKEELVEEESVDEATEKPEEDFAGTILTYTEGDLIELAPEAIDPDGDRVKYTFSEPISREGKWQTRIGDEGDYYVKVTASDGKLETEGYIKIVVTRANRAPVIDCVDKAVIKEGERFYVGDYCEISDEDDEEVVVYYGGWPGISRYTTTYEDAGTHQLLITANDKTHVVKQELKIVVMNVNRAPEFGDSFPTRIKGMEGDIITINTEDVIDPDGDSVKYTFSEPFNSKGIWSTRLGDAGEYNIDVVATDGETSTKKSIIVEISMRNTKPVLKAIPDIEVDEGDLIELNIVASDREGDQLGVEISGWMNSDSYLTTYDDAGEYTTTVKVTDGEFETSQIVHIKVNDVNRAPEFVKLG